MVRRSKRPHVTHATSELTVTPRPQPGQLEKGIEPEKHIPESFFTQKAKSAGHIQKVSQCFSNTKISYTINLSLHPRQVRTAREAYKAQLL